MRPAGVGLELARPSGLERRRRQSEGGDPQRPVEVDPRVGRGSAVAVDDLEIEPARSLQIEDEFRDAAGDPRMRNRHPSRGFDLEPVALAVIELRQLEPAASVLVPRLR